jgi:bifunctional non-homologous end joining protein LigD
MATLRSYRRKRNFSRTPEPRGVTVRKRGSSYVIQKHAARRLHYDLRLELDGAMKSWAVTRGPSLVPGDKRLAIEVEDHPIEYNKFEGTIPKGEYGGGTVMIWDRGSWFPEHDPHRGLKKGHLDFRVEGKKLKGRWHLVRMRRRTGESKEPWLLIKSDDEFARKPSDPDILKDAKSAASGLTMDEIAADRRKVWHSDKAAASSKSNGRKTKSRPTAAANASAQRRRSGTPRVAVLIAPKRLAGIAGARKARLPDFIEPCLATLSAAAPSTRDWVHEVKFDGYRIQARIDDGVVTLKTRTGLDWTKKFPTVADALAALTRHDAILDGEIVSLDKGGLSDFSALQDDLKSGRHDRLAYYAFDLLHLDGFDLTRAALLDRKAALQSLVAALPKNGVILLSEHFDADGPTMLKHARELRLEGIVSKRAGAPYRSGRGRDWLKIKCTSSQEFVVVGYEPSDKRGRMIRSLLLGYFENGALRYAGRVGTGWGQERERDLMRRLKAVARATPPLDPLPAEERGRRVQWVAPKMVVEVDFRGWTGGKLVRQASLRGVREDKPATQVVRETSEPAAESRPKQAALRKRSDTKKAARRTAHSNRVEVAGVPLTHPGRVYWADAGVTKEMLANHYREVWDRMRPHVTGRVLALLRCPDGTAGQCFFQKHASAGIDTSRLTLVKEPDGDRSIAIDNLDGLISLAQAGALEIHLRGSTVDRLEEADRLVFDLDPGPGVEWRDLVAAAREVRRRLLDHKLESFVKNTGGKGLHVVLPIRPAPWDQAKTFCRRIAQQMAKDSPARYVATSNKTARVGRIFVDYLRNSREATAIAPYSTRARPGAAVATPLSWDELGTQKTPNAFTVLNIGKRLARLKEDPWARMGRLSQRLPDAGRH